MTELGPMLRLYASPVVLHTCIKPIHIYIRIAKNKMENIPAAANKYIHIYLQKTLPLARKINQSCRGHVFKLPWWWCGHLFLIIIIMERTTPIYAKSSMCIHQGISPPYEHTSAARRRREERSAHFSVLTHTDTYLGSDLVSALADLQMNDFPHI